DRDGRRHVADRDRRAGGGPLLRQSPGGSVEHAQQHTAGRLTMHILKRLRHEEGQGMVEFAMVLPILMAVMLGIVQFGIIFNNYETRTDSSRVAARRAATARWGGGGAAAARQAAKDSSGNLDQSQLGIDIQACPPG